MTMSKSRRATALSRRSRSLWRLSPTEVSQSAHNVRSSPKACAEGGAVAAGAGSGSPERRDPDEFSPEPGL